MEPMARLQANDDALTARVDALGERVAAMERKFEAVPGIVRDEIRKSQDFIRAILIAQFCLSAMNFAGMFFGG